MKENRYMQMKRKWILILLITCFGGCNFYISPNVADAYDEIGRVNTFYGELVEKHYINNELVYQISSKECIAAHNQYSVSSVIEIDRAYFEEHALEKSELINVKSNKVIILDKLMLQGKELITYNSYKKQYCIRSLDLKEKLDDELNHGIYAALETGNLKDYVMKWIDRYEENYILKMEDDVRLNGELTQHIIGTSKQEGVEQSFEMWIDQRNWHIIKWIATSDDMRIEREYSKYEINSNIRDRQFKVEIPKDEEIHYIDKNFKILDKEIGFEDLIDYNSI